MSQPELINSVWIGQSEGTVEQSLTLVGSDSQEVVVERMSYSYVDGEESCLHSSYEAEEA